jgi:hypothetical protein
VERTLTLVNRFNGFYSETKVKPLKRFQLLLHSGTGLKPGANETTFEANPLLIAASDRCS